MESNLLLAHELVEEVNRCQNIPDIHFDRIEADNTEKFKSHSWGGTVHLTAHSSLAAAYAAYQLKAALQSDSLGSWLGERTPSFPQRWLWLVGSQPITVGEGLQVAFPYNLEELHLEKQASKIAKRLISLGFNGLIIGGDLGSEAGIKNEKMLSDLIHYLHNYELKIAVKFSTGTDVASLAALLKKNKIDALLWESIFPLQQGPAKSNTLLDLHREELGKIEKVLYPYGCSLLYYIPSPNNLTAKIHASIFNTLSDEAGNKTTITFSPVSGAPFLDHLLPHPFWDTLYKRQASCATPLLPLLNMGSLSLGEGLWPAPPLELIQRFMPSNSRHNFGGAIVLTKYLPCSGTPLDASLWITGHALFHKALSVDMLTIMWLKAFQPEMAQQLWLQGCSYCRQAVKELYYLIDSYKFYESKGRELFSRTELSSRVETSFYNLQAARQQFTKISQPSQQRAGANLAEYFRYFSRDLQRLLAMTTRGRNILLPKFADDKGPSFWTKEGGGKEQTSLLSQPHIDEKIETLHQIFLENNCFRNNV